MVVWVKRLVAYKYGGEKSVEKYEMPEERMRSVG
jgi:hypothetical protein